MTNTTIAHHSGAVNAVTIWSNSGSSVANYQNCIFSNPAMINMLSNVLTTNSLGNNISSDETCNLVASGDMPNTDPLLVSTTDLHLTACSPAIDHGIDAANSTTTDPDGNPRKFNAIPGGSMIDIGAFEYQSQVSAGTRWYVNEASLGGNGTSWACAFRDLQLALTASDSGDEIWVVAGTYKPTFGTDRSSAFVMKNGVAILGGFPNSGNPGIEDRNWNTNPTILSGDIGNAGENSDNSYHVILNLNNGLTSTSVLDGFTVSDGFSSNHGGGMYQSSSSPRIVNCLFVNNFTQTWGAAIYNGSSNPEITNCIFMNNHSNNNGGGVYNDNGSAPVFTNCLFASNTASIGGGGVANWDNVTAVFINCSFTGNSAVYGGGIQNGQSNPTFANCIIWNNSNEIGNVFSSNPTITYSIVKGGFPGTGNLDLDPLL
jgi:hypothetical protein